MPCILGRGDLSGCQRLVKNDGHTDVIVASEERRRDVPALVAIHAARVHVIGADRVFLKSIMFVSHMFVTADITMPKTLREIH